MYLYVTLLTLCLSDAVPAPPPMSIDDSLVVLSDLAESTNLAGRLILDESQHEIWRRKCEAHGGSEAFELSMHAGFQFTQCVQKIVNVTVLRREIAEASATGDLDEVFPKYCQRKNEFTDCLKTFIRASEVCFEEKELKQRHVIDDIIKKFVEFVCHKDGDRIAMFIADKGPQCFEKNWQEIQDCVNATYGSRYTTIPSNSLGEISEIPDIKEVLSFSFEKKDCLKINELQRCTVSAVELCDEATAANLLDSVFNYIRKSSPCLKLTGPLAKYRRSRRWSHRSPAASLPEL